MSLGVPEYDEYICFGRTARAIKSYISFFFEVGVRAFVPQAEGWVFESKLRLILVIKTGSDSSTAAIDSSDYTQMPHVTVGVAR